MFTSYNYKYSDMEFVKNFTPSDFQEKIFTPSISPNFNGFSKKKTQKMSENGEIYTAGKNFTLPPALTALTNSTSDVKIHYISLAWRNICYVELNNPGGPKRFKTFQISNAETSTQHGTFEQEQSRACRQEDGAGGEIAVNVLDPQRWRCHCILAPKPKAMVGARTIHTTHRQRKKWDKVALHRGGNWVGGQRRRRVLSKSDKVSIQFL